MKTFSRSSGPRSPSRGFTLLEVLLTSVLASVVLVSLWSLSDIYLKLFMSGERQIEETQLVRGLTQLFSRDLSQVVQLPQEDLTRVVDERARRFAGAQIPGERAMAALSRPSGAMPPAPGANSPAPAGPGASPMLESAARQSERSKPRFGLFGAKQALRLIVLQTDPRTVREITDMAEVMPQPGQSRPPIASELRTIEYSYSSSRQSVSGSNQHPPGLLRREWAWETWVGMRLSSLLSADSRGVSDMLPENPPQWTAEDSLALESNSNEAQKNLHHIPQVIGIEFQYFDGDVWEDEWNSWERKKLPLLVEVLLQIKINKSSTTDDSDEELLEEESSLSSSDGSAGDGSSSLSSSQGTIYRKLIHLPFAEIDSASESERSSRPRDDLSAGAPPRGANRP